MGLYKTIATDRKFLITDLKEEEDSHGENSDDDEYIGGPEGSEKQKKMGALVSGRTRPNFRKKKSTCSFCDEHVPLIRANSKFRTRWDILVIGFSLWICITLPVQIAFEPATLESLFNQVINIAADIIYIVDLFINFRTTIFNDLTNDEIFETKEIAIFYLKNRFILDLIASIPFDVILMD
jgi:hypothetical protein